MTPHGALPTPAHEHQSDHAVPHGGDHDHHSGLDLDALVFSDQLAAVLDYADRSEAYAIVDLGAGTGAGSRLLRNRYPEASVTCIDNDPQMVNQLRAQGFAVVEADLNNGFPSLPDTEAHSVDLIWASSSLHHISDPARLLAGSSHFLAPDGVLLVVELATLPSFLSHGPQAELEERCHAAATAEGWNYHPDWTPTIEASGFIVTKSTLTTTAPVTPEARKYAHQWFSRFAHLKTLSSHDRDDVTYLLDQLTGDLDLHPQATRTIWVATPRQ
jgi:SAM-dependent methyltransferase